MILFLFRFLLHVLLNSYAKRYVCQRDKYHELFSLTGNDFVVLVISIMKETFSKYGAILRKVKQATPK